METENNKTQQVSVQITSHLSSKTSAIFKRDEQLTPAMVTPVYIRNAAKDIVTASQSVEMVRGGQVFIPSVRKAVKDLGEKKIAAYIKLELIQLNTLLNLARPMTEQFFETAVPLILKHLTEEDVEPNLADLKIIFDRARTGFYGQYYGGIGYSDIIGWIDSYILDEKLPAIHAWHEDRYRQDDPYPRSSGGDREAFHAAAVWNQQREMQHEAAAQS